MNTRQTWADNAKLIGIFFVILGHNELANKGIENWILTFHMPLFFLLSGYFVKGDPEPFRSWLAKYAKRLLVPYLFFHLVTFPYDAYKIWSNPELYHCEHWWQLITKPLAGLFTVKSTSYAIFTNLPCWFFVCLFIVAMLFYPAKRQGCTPRFLIGSSVLTIVLFFALESLDADLQLYRIGAALLAYPFFACGYLLHHHTQWIPKLEAFPLWQLFVISVTLYALLAVVSPLNGSVNFFTLDHGYNIVLMYINAFIGTMATIALAMSIHSNQKISALLGGGTAIILGLHTPIQRLLKEVVARLFSLPSHEFSLLAGFTISLVVLLIFIPIIPFIERHFPACIGKSKHPKTI